MGDKLGLDVSNKRGLALAPPRRRGARIWGHPALWGVVGVGVGTLVTVLSLHAPAPAPQAKLIAPAPASAPAEPPRWRPIPMAAAPAKHPAAKPSKGGEIKPGSLPVFFASEKQRKPPKALKGKIALSSPLFLRPMGQQGGTTPVLPPVPGAAGVHLELVELSVEDPSAAAAKLKALTAQTHGKLRSYSLVSGKDESEKDGVLVFVPVAGLKAFMAGLSKCGVVASHDSRMCSIGDARYEVQKDAKAALGQLKTKRDLLLQTYFEDAPTVTAVDDEISQDLKVVSLLQLPSGSKMAFVRVTLN